MAPKHQRTNVRHLQAWREEIDLLYRGHPQHPIGQALLEPVQQFALPKEEFMSLIDGMEMDATPCIANLYT